MKRNPFFGARHSKMYKPSLVSTFLASYDKNTGECIKVHSDVQLLLRQKALQDTIGLESLKSYIEKLERPNYGARPQLTDDELLSMIEPRSINTITDCYQYSLFIADNEQRFKEKYEQVKNAYRRQQNINNSLKNS